MPDYDIVIIGAGIAGSTLAALLAPHARLALLDRDVRGLPGSTGHAPGIVAQVNSLASLTELARRSVEHYRSIPDGFQVVGGLEVVFGDTGRDWIRSRSRIAKDHGLVHEVLTSGQAAAISPFVRSDAAGGILYPNDGTANAKLVTRYAQDAAAAAGAVLRDGNVDAVTRNDEGYTVTTSNGAITARRVVVATGVWAGQLVPDLTAAAVAFAHSYAYSAPRPQRSRMPPYVRFPGAHVYTRDHGERDGLGSYKHDPIHMRIEVTAALPTAYAPWNPSFDHTLDMAASLLPPAVAERFKPLTRAAPANVQALATDEVPYSFTGMFTITPDGLPIVGRLDNTGLYSAVGCWVTHAAGTMGVLADQILADMGKAELNREDAWLREVIDPRRFAGIPGTQLEQKAYDKYRDIWNEKEQVKALSKL